MGFDADSDRDDRLMARVRDEDCTEAFAELYEHHAGPALSVASCICRSRVDAEKALQEGFLLIWRRRASYRPRPGSSFRCRAVQIVRDKALDTLHQGAGRPPWPVPSNGGGALHELPQEQAEVIWLAYFADMSGAQIAQHLALPLGIVKGRLGLGLEKLRYELDQGIPDASGPANLGLG